MRWLLRLLGWFLGVVTALLCISFAVGNRAPSIIQFWPFGFEMAMPVYLLAMLPLLLGLLLGGFIFWFVNVPGRIELQQLRQENERQRMSINKLKEELVEARRAPHDQKNERWHLPVNWF